MKADPNRKTDNTQKEKDNREPSSWTRQFHPSLERMRSAENNVASACEYQDPFQEQDK